MSLEHAVDAEIRLYEKLFTVKNPTGDKTGSFIDVLNPESLEILNYCKVEPSVSSLKPFERFQFERLGYFCIDSETGKDKLVINRTVELRDTWAKIQKKD